MKIKAYVLSLVMFIFVALTGCAFDDYENNLKMFSEFISKILYFYQGDGDSSGNQDDNGYGDSSGNQNDNGDSENEETQQTDYLVQFKKSIYGGKFFTLTKTAQTEYSVTQENVYFLGSYIYKVTEITGSSATVLHRLYLDSGLTYVYNGVSVTNDKAVDFISAKMQILNDLFSDSIAWEKLGDGYAYKNGNYEYYLEKGENENSLEYEIVYSYGDMWAVYKGEVTLFDELSVDMPAQLKQYI